MILNLIQPINFIKFIKNFNSSLKLFHLNLSVFELMKHFSNKYSIQNISIMKSFNEL